ncbi:NADP-dependent alcohol dehydrogenase C [Cordyceps fumosorosea ARSEF 2679]|uniref:NADP-dependent alcohol dehydrogenase C n=1 Tax=Cordyceps fumosorosea (strain ARSEF 2679) TaxID=1081104 RepID=A0A162JSZ2_CORFA|nr:NADP-dependent alcohol dehydrogenase C [Cordyceps fumosorosea ARSEF 2679]OAA73332.1 NADP-dependent alcohol dehydrogenase C [Cordyceps fumosorosea ARSEF 2679]
MGYPDTFTGFCVDGPKSWNKFHKVELKPKPFGDDDIDVQIEACSICSSDLHTITGGWGEYAGPLCVGHEVVGKAVKVGKHVSGIEVGDRVGVGAQVWSCLECDLCKDRNENYCPRLVDTYNAQYEDGSQAHGGLASHIRAHAYFTFRIPDELETDAAAPLLCAGITTYSPLVRAGVGPGKRVGVVGVGGLGHLGLQWAAALGAETYALTHSPSKVRDCEALGARGVILTTEDGWNEPWKAKFDFVLNCADATDKFDMSTYLSIVKPTGDFHMVGIPDKPLPQMSAGLFAGGAPKLTGSHLGNRQEMEALLKLAAEKGVRPWVEKMPISAESCGKAVEMQRDNKFRYRCTLTSFDEAFGRAE